MRTKYVIAGLIVVVGIGVLLAALAAARARAGSETSADNTLTQITHANPAEAAKLIAEHKVVVLDIRTPQEYLAGHIAGALLLDFYAPDFADGLAKLDKDKTWLVHCATGVRSTKALSTFRKLGFKSVVHLDGGFAAWKGAGEPVEK